MTHVFRLWPEPDKPATQLGDHRPTESTRSQTSGTPDSVLIMIRARWNGEVIAESDNTVIVEGNHYFPIDSVRSGVLLSSPLTTHCPWKGQASYYTLLVAGEENCDAAWYYPNPSAEARSIQDRVAFWRGVTIDAET